MNKTAAINKMLHNLKEFDMDANYITSNELGGIRIQPVDLSRSMQVAIPVFINGINHGIMIANDVDLAKMKEP